MLFLIPYLMGALVIALITHAVVRAIRPDNPPSLVRYCSVAAGFVLVFGLFFAYFFMPASVTTSSFR